jgi:hypothetical protein
MSEKRVIKVDPYDWLVKGFALIILGYSSYNLATFILLFSQFPEVENVLIFIVGLFMFACLLTFFAFYMKLRQFYFRARTKLGIWRTKKEKLDEYFKYAGGGYVGQPPRNYPHIAIIYPTVSRLDYPDLMGEHIEELMDYYKENKVVFNLYLCFLAGHFIDIFKSPNVTGVHIFGHGARDSTSFEDGYVQYREFKGLPCKEFIAQWHCNHVYSGTGISLGEYIGKKYFAPYGKRSKFKNGKDIKKLMRSELPWETNPIFSELQNSS